MDQVTTIDGTVFRIGDHIGSFIVKLNPHEEIGIVIGFDRVDSRYPTLIVQDVDFRFTRSTLYAHVIKSEPVKAKPSFFD